ncbi:hypothetical protein Tco_0545341, partial [Tanacetum coccineum]
MLILAIMLNDNIKASAEYSEYLAKSKGSASVKATGRGKEGAKDVDLEEIHEEPLVRRPTGIVIGGEGREGSGVTSEVTDELTLKSSNEEAGVILEVPDEPSDYSSSSSFDSEFAVKDILSDKDEVTEKADDVKKADVEKDTNEQVAEEHVAEKQSRDKEHGDNHGDNEPTGDAQADVQMSETQLEKPEATKVSSTLTLSSDEFTSQFLNDTPERLLMKPPLVNTTVIVIPDPTTVSPTQPPQTRPKRSKIKKILKKPKRPKTQVDVGELNNKVTRLEKKVHAMSSFNLPDTIDKSDKAHLKNVIPKDIPDFGKIKLDKAKKSMPKHSSTTFDQAALDEFEQKDKLFQMMSKSRSYTKHPAYKALFDALA